MYVLMYLQEVSHAALQQENKQFKAQVMQMEAKHLSRYYNSDVPMFYAHVS